MFHTILDFFNARSSGEQVLILIGGGVACLFLGIQVGRLAASLFG